MRCSEGRVPDGGERYNKLFHCRLLTQCFGVFRGFFARVSRPVTTVEKSRRGSAFSNPPNLFWPVCSAVGPSAVQGGHEFVFADRWPEESAGVPVRGVLRFVFHFTLDHLFVGQISLNYFFLFTCSSISWESSIDWLSICKTNQWWLIKNKVLILSFSFSMLDEIQILTEKPRHDPAKLWKKLKTHNCHECIFSVSPLLVKLSSQSVPTSPTHPHQHMNLRELPASPSCTSVTVRWGCRTWTGQVRLEFNRQPSSSLEPAPQSCPQFDAQE